MDNLSIKNREPVTVKMTNHRKNGNKFLNEFTLCPVKDANDKITHCIGLEKEL